MVVDAGLKALSLDSGVPKIPLADFGVPVEFRSGGDEHGTSNPYPGHLGPSIVTVVYKMEGSFSCCA